MPIKMVKFHSIKLGYFSEIENRNYKNRICGSVRGNFKLRKKGESRVVPFDAINTQIVSIFLAPVVLNLARRRRMFNFSFRSLLSKEKKHGAHCRGGLVDPRLGLNLLEKGNIFFHCRNSKYSPSTKKNSCS
jgi:hypothetical protein